MDVSGDPVSISGLALEDAASRGPGGALVNTGTLSLSDCAFVRNGSQSEGGAISNFGTLSVADCAFRDNVTGTNGGAIHNEGTLSIDDSQFVANRARTSGGALYDEFGARMRVGSSVFLENIGGWGSAIYTAGPSSIERCDISSNAAAYYGAVYVRDALVIRDTTIDRNWAGYDAAGLNSSYGDVLLLNTTVSRNQSDGRAGGIFSAGGTTTLLNSTVSGNRAVGRGGGIWNGGRLNVLNSTIAGNFSAHNGGGLANRIIGTVRMKDTILAGNNAPIGPDCAGDPIQSLGHNLLGNAGDCSFVGLATDRTGSPTAPVVPKLLPLADNGGPTETHALEAGSPAVDAGHPEPPGTGLACTPTDQRGAARPSGAACDIGAYELD